MEEFGQCFFLTERAMESPKTVVCYFSEPSHPFHVEGGLRLSNADAGLEL